MVSAFFFTSAKVVSGNGPTSPVRWHWVQFSKTSGAMFFVKVTGASAAAAWSDRAAKADRQRIAGRFMDFKVWWKCNSRWLA